MRRIVNFCDYFVICSSSSQRRIGAIVDGIDEGLVKYGFTLSKIQGGKDSEWVLFDAGDVVAHIFGEKIREFYGLEYLWQAAPRVNWKK